MTYHITDRLFIFEMANNHNGNLEHGIKIIKAFQEVAQKFKKFNFAIKLQHRDISFIHPEHVHRKDHKLIKRFSETKLQDYEFKFLKEAIKEAGFTAICTPWDEASVDLMEELDFDIIKIASCSFTDWPLLEAIAKTSRPIIASTAGARLKDIDKVVDFFTHRRKEFALMHCVGEYPCPRNHLDLGQISFLKERYPRVDIGFSTHEHPKNVDSIKIAIAQGATIFEKHIGLNTEQYPINEYSVVPCEATAWLEAAVDTYQMLGKTDERKSFSKKEIDDLTILHRGVYAKRDITEGEKISDDDIFCAMPNIDDQLTAHDLSKYTQLKATSAIKKNAPIFLQDLEIKETQKDVAVILMKLKELLRNSGVAISYPIQAQISHHYGIENFFKTGAVLINIVNRSYSKMLVCMFPKQSYPIHKHLQKDETLQVLYGELQLHIDGTWLCHEADLYEPMTKGSTISIEKGQSHAFHTTCGVIIEEISTTYLQGDSIYLDDDINNNKDRKTIVTLWQA